MSKRYIIATMMILAAVLLGVNAIIGQILLIRELLVNFSGNELSMGIILSVWLIGGAIGSLFLGRWFIDKIKNPLSAFSLTLCAISILSPAIIFSARCVRQILHIPIYEMLSPLQTLSACALIILPLSCLLSFCFICLCKTFKEVTNKTNSSAVVYIFEALGATTAGALFTFLLARYFNSFQIIIILSLINSIFLLRLKRNFIYFILSVLFLTLLVLNFPGRLQNKSEMFQWYPQKVLSYKNSPYGNISATKTGEIINFYENGSLFFTTEDEAFNEEFAHLIMLQHPNPKKVLLVGGGVGGLIKEILKHNPQKLTYLELDPLTVKIAREFVSDKDKFALSDQRLKILHEDGRFFIKMTKDKFDIIIVNLPDPTTLQLNRFYTIEFYKQAKRCMAKDAIFACRLSSQEAIISDELARYNASIYKTLSAAFSYVTFLPGEQIILTASDNPGLLNNSTDILTERFTGRNISTRFLTVYHIKDKYYPYTLSYVKEKLDGQRLKSKINSDFHPICFYYDLVLWGIRFHPRLAGFFKSITNINMLEVTFAIILIFPVGIFLIRKKRRPINFVVPFLVAVAGVLGITLELLLILSFQVFYGYTYSNVGLLIALFMLGVAGGAFIMEKGLAYYNIKRQKMLGGAISALLCQMIFFLIIIKIAQFIPLGIIQILFYLMIFKAGMWVGCQFPAAVSILQDSYSSGYAASLVWGADLLGAMIGGLVSSLIIIPVLGITNTILAGFTLGFITCLLLAISLQRPQQ